MNTPNLLLKNLKTALASHANPEKAQKQQAYMKSALPFWGAAKPIADALAKELFKANKPQNNDEYRATIRYIITNATHREEWYAAIGYARAFKKYIVAENLDLYLELVQFTQWWDIVDTVAVHLIGKALKDHEGIAAQLHSWITHENMWVRRTALLAQLSYKADTDSNLLKELILLVTHEKEFFIRKAIGWVLREYSKTNPVFVRNFIREHKVQLSPLSLKEASKYI